MTYFIAGISLVFIYLSLFHFKRAFFLFLFLYAAFPRYASASVTSQDFALSLQVIMAGILTGAWLFYTLLGYRGFRFGVLAVCQRQSILLPVAGLLVLKTFASLIQTSMTPDILFSLLQDSIFSGVIVFIAAVCIRERRDLITACWMLVLAILVNEVWAILEMLRGGPLLQGVVENPLWQESLGGTYRGGSYRVMGTFITATQFSAFLCIVLPFAFYVFQASSRPGPRTASWLALLLALPVIFWTQSRGGILLLGILYTAHALDYILRSSRLNRNLKRALTWAIMVIIAVLSLSLVQLISTYVTGRSAILQEPSAHARLSQFEISQKLLEERLWLGYGRQRNLTKALRRLPNLDNFYLRTSLECGIGGVVLLLWLMLAVGRLNVQLAKSGRLLEDQHITRALGLHVLMTGAVMMISMEPYSYMYLYVFAGGGVSLCLHFRQERSREPVGSAYTMLAQR